MFFNNFIDPAIWMARKDLYECAKVDVVAHSMGGLVAKAFALDKWYSTYRSYGQGSIRRLVTLGTPHWGSGYFSYLQKDVNYLRDDFFEESRTQGNHSTISSWCG